jgi:2-keto-4-pentenoate hydratase/2-oxohepta-3-ene-1,7-dioic acid hydratase in catechol pathway
LKLLSYVANGEYRLGALVGEDRVLDLRAADPQLPHDMVRLIAAGGEALDRIRTLLDSPRHDMLRPLEGIALTAPIPRPQKNIFCVGRNYKEHILEGARARGVEVAFPAVPEFFTKPTTAVIGPEAGIERHGAYTDQLDYEVELAVVIGRRTRDIAVGEALDSVFGYTIVNDVSARDRQRAHGQWFKGKSYDSFCPMGPWIVTAEEFGRPENHRLSLTVNGQTRQDSTTSDLLFSVSEIIAHLSAGLTLEAGDVIATGTPSGVGMGMIPQVWLMVGDVVEARIEGIGILRNTVIP